MLLQEFQYYPTDEEAPFYPEMYESALECIQQMAHCKLPSQKVQCIVDAYTTAQTSIAYCLLTNRDEDQFDLEPLSAESRLLLLSHCDFEELLWLDYVTKPVKNCVNGEMTCIVSEAVTLIEESARFWL